MFEKLDREFEENTVIPTYKRVFGESLQCVAEAMKETVKNFPEEKQDISTYFRPLKPKEKSND